MDRYGEGVTLYWMRQQRCVARQVRRAGQRGHRPDPSQCCAGASEALGKRARQAHIAAFRTHRTAKVSLCVVIQAGVRRGYRPLPIGRSPHLPTHQIATMSHTTNEKQRSTKHLIKKPKAGRRPHPQGHMPPIALTPKHAPPASSSTQCAQDRQEPGACAWKHIPRGAQWRKKEERNGRGRQW